MQIDTSTNTNNTTSSKLDTAVEATHKGMEPAAAVGKEGVEGHQNAKLDAEFALIMQRHGHTIEALKNR
ncbi:type II toxin-antitoxin system prevent-host-death family antitoxin [Pectobacterium brasiliense]|uniref:type II toxin-antitoxin system prevent-host-death family antitoxin n=1 Tax=Pectobacterium brasiliense TaxID=180957 RepID=UPI001CE18FB3|nr:type II toxin-antitoxin system prevent-host-death family antitoxin [Pectobacterium brasiliense]MCA5921252.1 type II toxin-antitoxin system prevent-host-death family antitoxin [Pectobacterium brasiliense]MCA5928252.1 type II toxin-antitoxin system prevent-host-death family antitoxin [Pectobacterium brasiliense]MCA5937274.1 type II toxin-antitoxin system prevent-host-death family antitoxin [Pectobacterium brasiliense]MCA5941150.1 type II toxin-antitoxin system prevent-host-death family antitox